MKYFLLSWVVIFLSVSTSAQTWKELSDQVIQLYNKGEYEKAISIAEKASEIAKKEFGETDSNYASSLNDLAILNLLIGQFEKAEPLLVKAKEIFKTLGESNPNYITVLTSLAQLYSKMGQYQKAEPLFLQAKEIDKKVLGENTSEYARTLSSLADLYREIGQYNKAEPLSTQASEICKKVLGETNPDYATCLNNLGLLYLFMGQYEKAEPLYMQSNEIYKKALGEDHPNYIMSLNNLATVYFKMDQYIKAEQYYIKVIEIDKKVLGVNHPDYAMSLNNLGLLYFNMGQYEKAETFYNLAKEIWWKTLGENHPFYAISLINLALLYSNMGQYNKTEQMMLLNTQIVLQNILNTFTILSEKEKGNYLNNTISILGTNNSFLHNYKNASSSILKNNFNLQLVLKSVTLTDSRNILQSVRTSKDTTIKKIFEEWQSNKSLLAKQYSLPANRRMKVLDSVESKTENLEKELSRRSSEFRNQQTVLRISMQDMQKGLEEDEAALEFVRFRLYNKKWTDSVMYAAYVLRKTDSVPQFVDLCEERQLQQLFDETGKTTTDLVSSFYRGGKIRTDMNLSKADSLYKLIWEPLEPYLKGIKKVSYSPAGKLYTIAFHALPAGEGKLLMDKYHLNQYTSTRQIALRSSPSQTTKPRSIALFGNASFSMDSLQLVKSRPLDSNIDISTSVYTPQNRGTDHTGWNDLPGTAAEVKKIEQLFTRNKISTKTFIQSSCSEENLKSLSGGSPQIVHIATHGFFLLEPDRNNKTGYNQNQNTTYSLADDPLLRSGLIFAGGNYAWSGKNPIGGIDDGICTAYEISQLNLSNTELVVLSACETALGDVKGSEGVFGLQRGFKMAGVDKLIVSLWQVPDKETAELMISFYRNWFGGKSINESFYLAQADMRKKYNPFYWAAFVLVE